MNWLMKILARFVGQPDDDLQVRYLGDLQRLQLQDGEVFVLTSDADLNPPQIERLRASWESVMGKEAKLLVLTAGMKLGAVSSRHG